MRFIFNPEDSDTFKAEHFKFLGRWIHYRLSEQKIKTKIWDTILKDFQTVDNSLVNGFMKLWIYQFYILAQLSWPFLIYDFNRSFVVDLQREVNTLLKKWAGIYRSSDNGLLFHSKEHFRLGLHQLLTILRKCSSSSVPYSKTRMTPLCSYFTEIENKPMQNSVECGKLLNWPKQSMLKLL